MIKAYLDFDADKEYPELEHDFIMIPQIPTKGDIMSFSNTGYDYNEWKLLSIDYLFVNGVFDSVHLYLRNVDYMIEEKIKLKKEMDIVTLQLKQYNF